MTAARSEKRWDLARWKDAASLIQSVAVATGVIAGSIWYFWQQENLSRANIRHCVRDFLISGEDRWLKVDVDIKNVGNTPLEIETAEVWVQQVLPLVGSALDKFKESRRPSDSKGGIVLAPQEAAATDLLPQEVSKPAPQEEIMWPLKEKWEGPKSARIHPGETDKVSFDFVIPASIEMVKIYSHFPGHKELGWNGDSVHVFDNRGGRQELCSSDGL